MGMKIAMENHADFTVRELASIHARVTARPSASPSIAPIWPSIWTTPLRLAEILAPHALTTHFKNYRIIRTRDGLGLENGALGDGDIDLAAIAETLAKYKPDINLNIEIHSQFAPFKLNILKPAFWSPPHSPPGDGLAWYLAKAWDKPAAGALAGEPAGRAGRHGKRESERSPAPRFAGQQRELLAQSLTSLVPESIGASHEHGDKRRKGQSDRKIRIGMLGCGFMGKCHSNAYKKIPYIYAAAGFAPRLAGALRPEGRDRRTRGRPLWLRSLLHRLEGAGRRPANRRVRQLRPDPVHPEPCIAALKDGKHVICEKPMADPRGRRPADARRRRRRAGKSMCTFNYRFMPAVRLAKDLITDGRIGTIYHIRIHYLQMAGHDPSLPPDKVWYSAWPFSGGLQGIGSHAIDQCRFLVGEIASVSALVRAFNKDRAVTSFGCPPEVTADEGTAAVLDFENGEIGVLEASEMATGRKNYLGWEINGSKGSLRWDLEHPNSLFACLDRGEADDSLLGFTEISVTESCHPYVGPWWPQGHNIGWEHGQIIEKFHFLDAVAHQKPLNPYNATFEDGYRVAVDHRRHARIQPNGTASAHPVLTRVSIPFV